VAFARIAQSEVPGSGADRPKQQGIDVMKLTTTLTIALGLGALAACNKGPQENNAENIEANYDNTAGAMEENVGNTMEANTENAANAIGNEGENAAAAATNTGNGY
jgi:hypothetical protein